MKKVVYSLFILLLLIGCSKKPEVTREFTDLLMAVNEKENNGNNFVRKLYEKEQKEQKIFNLVMELTQQQHQEVRQHVVTLKKSAYERSVLLEKEGSSILESNKVLDQLSEWMNQSGFTNQLKEVVEALYERTELHEAFILQYKKLIDSQMRLYTQLEDQSVRERELQKQVSEVNELINASQQILVEFNEATKEVNRLTTRALKSLEELE